MKISKFLNKTAILVLIFYFFQTILLIAVEPIDIWKIEKIANNNKDKKNQNEKKNDDVFKKKITNNQTIESIVVNENLDTINIKLAGLYDPAENGLSIDMWSASDGSDIKNLLKKINTQKLSNFSQKILDIALLTNSYIPQNNISIEEFLNFKFEYLKNKKDFELIKIFLNKNPSIKNIDNLVIFYTDYYLSNSQLDKACEIFDIKNLIINDYLLNFKIYCLVNTGKKEQAQLLFDLRSEIGSIDEFFKNKFNVLMGYNEVDETLSDSNILNFHLSHRTNQNFEYEPKLDTPKFIWKYLSTSNLLKDTNLVDIEDSEQVKLVEIATNEDVYEEIELLDLYKRFQFDINQLINVNDSYKLLPDYKGRALLYQRLLLTADAEQKLILSSALKKSFDQSELFNIFETELVNILKTIELDEIPSNYTTFYKNNIQPENNIKSKIKFNNKIIHQSKLLNYFLNKTSLPKVEKETNDLLKKVKKNKKYAFSKKDIIMIESLKSDGVQIMKKYENMYENNSKLPSEINTMILNGEIGLVLLKLVEIIGEDEIENLDFESIDKIVGIMNAIKIIDLRNEVLLKVLPLKV